MKVFGNRIMVLLITAFVLARAFDCSYIQDQDSCLSLDGCTWPTDKCKGSFLSNCQVPDCYYVDPLNGLDSQNGNVSTPFNSLTSAFRKLGILSGNIILLNYRPQAETDILDYTTINSNITVKPLFPNNKYTISLANFNISSLPTNEKSALTVNSGMLTLIGCTINDRTSREGLGSIFEVGNANLIFKNVNIVDYQGTIPLVMIAADKATASFNYLGGNHQNSSFWFSLLAGIHIMKDLQIENNKAPDQLIYVGNKLNISNVTVSKGASLLLKLMEQTSVNVSNVIVSNYTNGFINGVNPGSVNISLSKFQDLDLGTSSLITLQIFVNPNNPVRTPFWTNHTIFQNVNVTKSVLSVNLEDDFVLLYNYAYYMFNVTMTNITKKVPVNNTPSASDDIGGVCFWGQRIALNFNASTFINVSSHCIFTEDARVVATSNVFDNSKLKATLLAPGDIISDSQGVSWISLSCFISTTPLQVVSTITGNSFIENKILTRYGGAIRLIGECYYVAQIINNIFTGNTAVDGGAIYSGSPFSLLILMNNVYTNNSAMNGGAICKVTPAYRLPFVDTTTTTAILAGENFTSNTASYKGGAIYLEWESLILANSLFNNSRAQYGGALYFASLNVVPTSFNKLNNNTFESNTATISGSAMKLLFDFSKTDSILSKTRTYSYYCAGTPNCQFTIPVIPIPSNFTNNVDPKNQNISDSKPTSFNFSFYDILLPELTIAGNEDFNLWIGNTTRTRLSDTWNNLNFSQDFTINQKSGHNLSQIILVEVIDQYGLPVDFIFNESVSASITANQNHVNDFKASLANSIETFSFNRGRLFMKSVVIVGHPNTTATLTIQTLDDTLSILKDANLDLSHNIQIYFQPCELGDMYQPITHTCYTCPEGSYTLLEPNSSLECIPCDNKRAICPGGSRIAPKPGFWRYSNTSDNIVECENEEACLGGLINNAYSPQGECAFPYQGNLCNECAYGYAKFGNASSCVDCTMNFGYYVKMAGFLLIQIVIVLYAVKSNVDRISEIKRSQTEDSLELKMKIQNETLQSNLLKVGVNFIQSSTVILTLQLEWPDFVDNVIGSTNRIFPTYQDGFSINCVIALVKGNNQDLYFIQYIANLIEPFGLWLIIILFYMLYLRITAQPIFSNPKLKQTCFVLFLIIGFLLQPNIIQTSLSLFACRNLNSSEDPIYYMNEDTEVQCWTFRHMVWCLAVAMPNLILWAVVLPLILFIKIRKHKKCLKDLDFESKYSFILQRLKNNRYYWEFVALLRKIALIVTSTLFSFLSKKSQAIAVFFMISIFTFLHLKYRPYMDKQVNRAEFLSLISLSSLAFCGVFFAKGKSEELGRILFTTVACVSNIMFFAYLGLHLTKSYLHTIKKFLHKLLSDEKEKKEEKVEGSVLSVNPLPCQSVDEVEDKSSSPADQQKENIISL